MPHAYNNATPSANERLHRAVKEDNLEEVDAALRDGAGINYVNNTNGITPLIRAVRHQHIRTVLHLLTLGAQANREELGPDHDQALHVAARQGCLTMVKALLNAGAMVDHRNELRMTPLHMACEKGHAPVAELLLNHGADVHAVGDLGKQPLHQALSKRSEDTVKVLLAHGANPNHGRGESPLDWARRKGRGDLAAMVEVILLRQTLDTHLEAPNADAPLSPRERPRL